MLEGYLVALHLAHASTRARVGVLATGSQYRHPGLLVKLVTTLDVLSGGRALCILGAGWNEEESRGLGVPMPATAERFDRLEDTVRRARQMFAGDEAAFKDVPIEGDSAFAQEISYLVRNLKWDVEEDLSKVVGDVAAHRTVNTAKSFTGWAKQSTENRAQNFKEYWTEEKPLVAKSIRLEEFAKQVDTLRDDVERLEKRIDNLS
mgnify:CR=1 FL=1